MSLILGYIQRWQVCILWKPENHAKFRENSNLEQFKSTLVWRRVSLHWSRHLVFLGTAATCEQHWRVVWLWTACRFNRVQL